MFDAKCLAEHCSRAELCVDGLRTVAAILGVLQLIPAPLSLVGTKSHNVCCIYNVLRMVLHIGTGYDGLIDGIYQEDCKPPYCVAPNNYYIRLSVGVILCP